MKKLWEWWVIIIIVMLISILISTRKTSSPYKEWGGLMQIRVEEKQVKYPESRGSMSVCTSEAGIIVSSSRGSDPHILSAEDAILFGQALIRAGEIVQEETQEKYRKGRGVKDE